MRLILAQLSLFSQYIFYTKKHAKMHMCIDLQFRLGKLRLIASYVGLIMYYLIQLGFYN